MTDRPTSDEAIAADLRLPVEAVRRERVGWNEQTILRAVFSERMKSALSDKTKMLETIEPEALQKTQGIIAGLRLALGLITKTES